MYTFAFSGMFAKLLLASSCLSIRVEQLCSQLMDFDEILIFAHFSKTFQENSSFTKIRGE
jgi:hypothetical protein